MHHVLKQTLHQVQVLVVCVWMVGYGVEGEGEEGQSGGGGRGRRGGERGKGEEGMETWGERRSSGAFSCFFCLEVKVEAINS